VKGGTSMEEKKFNEIQESIINEIGYALNELICGRTEEAYNILVNLRDELTIDVINSKDGEEKVDRLIKAAGVKYIENEYKKETEDK
jgi:hypothetical protein